MCQPDETAADPSGEGLIDTYQADYTAYRMDASRRTRWSAKRRGPRKA